jgi:dTDP-4-amino-4,6-dideoxygalactose transaminase
LYVIQVENRKGLYNYLKQHNIFAQVHYIPVTTLPYYKQLGYKTECYPNAKNYYDKCLSIPMYPTLTEEEQDFVIAKIFEFINNEH